MASCALKVAGGYESDHDRLSELPDHILLSILERLRDDVRLLARTCVLSKRWRTLPLMLSGLEISVRTFVPADCTSTLQRVRRATDKFTGAVRFFLATPTAGDRRAIKTLRLKLYLAKVDSLHDIVHLVGNAIGRGEVQDLELVVYTEKGKAFLRSAAETVKVVLCYGRRFMRLLRGAPAAVFRSLKTLSLQNLCFRAPSDVGVLLRTCTALEVLALDYCGFANFSTVLSIDAPPHSQLKLVRLLCRQWFSESCPVTFGPGSVPSLEEITLDNRAQDWQRSFSLSELLANAHGVETLRLAFNNDKIWLGLENPRNLSIASSKLKMLHLTSVFPEGDLSWTLFLLQAAPFLELLDIDVYSNHVCRPGDEDRDIQALDWEVPHGFKHHHLRFACVRGGIDAGKDARFVRLLMERAVNLELLVLRGRIACKGCIAVRRQDAAAVLSMLPEDKDGVDAFVRQLEQGISTTARILVYSASYQEFAY
ncbi:hypothetical protein ACP70R_048052 [Stipagrostis hirtigluma subsp. patula]